MQNLSDNHILVILFIIVIVLCCQRLLCMFDDYVMMGNAEWALSKMYECTMYLIRNEIEILRFFCFDEWLMHTTHVLQHFILLWVDSP